MSPNAAASAGADAIYKREIARAPGVDTLVQGIHGVTVYLLRAKMRSDGKGWKDGIVPSETLASADRLLAFMARVADTGTPLGECLERCYHALQRCINILLTDTGEEGVTVVLDAAIEASKGVERDLKTFLGREAS